MNKWERENFLVSWIFTPFLDGIHFLLQTSKKLDKKGNVNTFSLPSKHIIIQTKIVMITLTLSFKDEI